MTRLAPDSLAGVKVGFAAPSGAGAAGSADLLAGLVGLGAKAVDQGAVDLLLVPIEADASLDAAADGTLAASLIAAFAAARDGASRLCPGGCVLFLLTGEDPARAAIGSLTRTLALEWAPSLRVNAIVRRDPAAAVDLIALVAGRASRALTGAVLEGGAG
jgi:hypothetical protein